jgi:O-antigen ligase
VNSTGSAIGSLDVPLLSGRGVWVLAAIVQGIATYLALQYGWIWAVAPLVALTAAVIFIDVRIGFFLLIPAMFFAVDLPWRHGLYVSDIVIILIVVIHFVRRVFDGQWPYRSRSIVLIVAGILVAFSLSLFRAHDVTTGVVNWLRHVQLLLLMLTAMTCLERDDILRLLKWFLLLTVIMSIINVGTFIWLGGEYRIFGPAGQHFERYAVAMSLYAATGFLLTRRYLYLLGWGSVFAICAAAVVATQTRGAMVQLMTGLFFLSAVLWIYARAHRHRFVRRRIGVLSVGLGVVLILLVAGALPFLETSSSRILEALRGGGTVHMRLILWRIGVQAFLDSPLLGYGLGQVTGWHEYLSFWRFDLAATTTAGTGVHNDLIRYAVETGLIGLTSLVVLFVVLYRRGLRLLRQSDHVEETRRILVLWCPVIVLSFGILYSYELFYSLSGTMTALYFGMWLKYSDPSRGEGSVTRATRR